MIRVTQFLRHPVPGFYSIERLYADVRAALPADFAVAVRVSRFPSRGFWRRLFDTLNARRYQGDINHVLGDVHFLTLLLDPRRTILTIHDCVALERLAGLKRWVYWLFWCWLAEKRCSAIVVVSTATRDQVLAHLRCDPAKVRLIYNHLSSEFQPTPQRLPVPKPRLLHMGTTPNKNLERHVAALRGLDCELVVIGVLTPAQRDLLDASGLAVKSLVDLSREEILEQYRRCDVLLFASTYEGFGLPIVEAQATGRPVVTSRLWSMPEVAGEGACLVDPYDVASIRAGIDRILGDAAYREHLVTKGFENVRRFDLATIAAQYAALYRAVQAQAALGSRGRA